MLESSTGKELKMTMLRYAVLPYHMQDDDRVTATDQAVFLALVRFADSRGVCWPSSARIAQVAKVSRTTVFRSLNNLESLGYVVRDVTPGKGTVYHLRMLQTDEQAEYVSSHMPKWASKGSESDEQAEGDEDYPADCDGLSEGPSTASEPSDRSMMTNTGTASSVPSTAQMTTQRENRDPGVEHAAGDGNYPTKHDNAPTTSSMPSRPVMSTMTSNTEYEITLSPQLEQIRNLWPKPARRTQRLEDAYRRALTKTSNENLEKAARDYASRSASTDLQFVKSLVCWLEDASNWVKARTSSSASYEKSEGELSRLVLELNLGEWESFQARRLYFGAGGSAEKVREYFGVSKTTA